MGAIPGKRLKITHFCVGLDWGGAERLIFDIATRVNHERFDITVVALRQDGAVGDVLRKAGIRVVALGAPRYSLWSSYRRWCAYLEQAKPDLIHSHLHIPNLLACLSATRYRVMTHHHYVTTVGNPLTRFLEKQLAPRAHRLIAVSQTVKDHLLAQFPAAAARIELLPNAVDTDRFVPAVASPETRQSVGLPAQGPVIGYIGRIVEPIKGLKGLLTSFSAIKKQIPEAALLLAGEGPDREGLHQLAKSLAIDSSVVWLGHEIPSETLYPLLSVFVLPSLSEGFGLAVLEAMASGVPVVAADVGGVPEMLTDTRLGLRVPPGDVSALTAALLQVLKDPTAARQMGQAAREHTLRHFRILPMVQQLENLYESLVESPLADRRRIG